MKRIAILTAGGDTPALNATIYGAVTQANRREVEVIGLLRGFDSLFDDRVPHIRLNPLFGVIPELDPNRGGTILGSSRKYIEKDAETLEHICGNLRSLDVDGLICVGGDGTMNGLQSLCDTVPTVLAPKTIDNDLGLNFSGETDLWERLEADPKAPEGYRFQYDDDAARKHGKLRLEQMVNYVTPGYATAVFVSAGGVHRLRTTAESHRRVAIVEVMGRHSGFIALGSAYGQPDIVLVPEVVLDIERLVERVKEIYERQQNVVIVCGEGIVDKNHRPLGASEVTCSDPAGNVLLSGAAESLKRILVREIGDEFFEKIARKESADRAIFTRKVGHTQRGGRPVAFDRFHAAMLGGKAFDMLHEGQNNAVATLTYIGDGGFDVDSVPGTTFRDRWGVIHARRVHPTFYDEQKLHIAEDGMNYLMPIFRSALGVEDTEHMRQTVFDTGNLFQPYHSVNRDVQRRTEFLR